MKLDHKVQSGMRKTHSTVLTVNCQTPLYSQRKQQSLQMKNGLRELFHCVHKSLQVHYLERHVLDTGTTPPPQPLTRRNICSNTAEKRLIHVQSGSHCISQEGGGGGDLALSPTTLTPINDQSFKKLYWSTSALSATFPLPLPSVSQLQPLFCLSFMSLSSSCTFYISLSLSLSLSISLSLSLSLPMAVSLSWRLSLFIYSAPITSIFCLSLLFLSKPPCRCSVLQPSSSASFLVINSTEGGVWGGGGGVEKEKH